MLKYFSILVFFMCLPGMALAQTTDTLTLDEVIRRVISTYPSVRQAEEAIKTASYNVKMAQAALLPVLSVSASYTRIEPVAKVHFEEMDLPFSPRDNYDAGLSVRQLIYDFGKNRPKIEAAREREKLSHMQQNELFQSLAWNAVQLYYMNCLTRQAIQIKQQELNEYEEMLRQAEVRTRSGSSTSFDLLNTQVSQSAVNTQLIELTANLRTQQVQLSVLADTSVVETIPLDGSMEIKQNVSTLDDLIAVAYLSRTEMQLVDKQIAIARLEESAARKAYNPSLDLSATAGSKNGYPVHIDRMKLNYEAGVMLSIPLYEGGRRKQSVSLAKSAYNTTLYQKEVIERQIQQQVSENFYVLMSDYTKLAQLDRQVALATKAYEQAKVNYEAGAITNLELLTSSTNLSSSRLQLLQAKISYQIDYYKLQVSIGTQIW